MKIKQTLILLAMGGVAAGAWAQGGYQDGVDYYNADRYEQAKIILNKTIGHSATNQAEAYYYLGAIDMRENKIAEAKANFDKGIAANPAFSLNYVGLGEISLKNGDKKVAEGLFNDALRANKKDAQVNAAIARAYFNVDPTAYSKEIDKYIANALKYSNNKSSAAYVLKGDIAKANNEIGQAAGFYEQAITYEEQDGIINPEAYVKYANLYNKVNNQFSIAKLEELKSKLPSSALAMRELAEKYYDSELFGKAAAQYEEYMKNPNHFQQDEQRFSQLLYFSGKNKESLDIAKGVLAKDPDNFYMYRMVLVNDDALGNNEEAEQYGKKLFASPNASLTANDFRTYASVLGKLGKFDEAAAIYDKGYSANPEKNVSMLADASAMFNDAENYAKAVEYQQMYVDKSQPSLNDIFTLANRYRNLALSNPAESPERIDAAEKGIKYIDLGLSKNPVNTIPFYRNRGVLLQLRDGQDNITDDLAQNYLTLLEVLDADPENIKDNEMLYKQAYASLGMYYNGKKDKANARVYFQKLYDLAPDTPGVGEWLKKN